MRRCAAERGMTVIELAITFAIGGSLLAVAVPAFFRELKASKLSEAIEGITQLAGKATAYARTRDVAHAYPPSAPLTPSQIPRGRREIDPPGTWDQPTWRALDFQPTAEGIPHAFSFELESRCGSTRSSFVARAHGDLDGDGVPSTFETSGHVAAGGAGPVIDPGVLVEAEVE